MTVYVLIREDQNHYGYVDTTIAGIFHQERIARQHEEAERARALQEGLRVCDDEESDPDWQVSWKIEDHAID
jgi:hypothetical protein